MSVTLTTNDSGRAPWGAWIQADSLGMLKNHKFFRTLQDDQYAKAGLQVFMAQHQLYSRFFTRNLCAVISNIPISEDIAPLMGNLVEEMGLDDAERMTHAQLFKVSMRSVDVEPGRMPPLAATARLSAAMAGYCHDQDAVRGLAALCLGAEAIVPIIYQPIVNTMERVGVSKDGQHFFRLHVDEDEDHAITMLAIMERLCEHEPKKRLVATSVGSEMIRERLSFLDAIDEQTQFVAERLAQ
jgi:pyrroloquinoline-quinone synthase